MYDWFSDLRFYFTDHGNSSGQACSHKGPAYPCKINQVAKHTSRMHMKHTKCKSFEAPYIWRRSLVWFSFLEVVLRLSCPFVPTAVFFDKYKIWSSLLGAFLKNAIWSTHWGLLYCLMGLLALLLFSSSNKNKNSAKLLPSVQKKKKEAHTAVPPIW